MIEQPLDLRRARLILRRYRMILAAVAMAGAGGGIALALLQPPLPTSTALVLLPPAAVTSTGSSLRDIDTQIRIATGQQILSAAASRMSPPKTADTVKSHVRVLAPTVDLLSIRAQARTGPNAETLANGVASGYVSYVNNESTTAIDTLKNSLRLQEKYLDRSVAALLSQIGTIQQRLVTEGASSSKRASDQQLLAALHTEASTAALQKTSITTQIAGAQASSGQGATGARVFQTASPATSESLRRRQATYGAIGAIGALLCAAVATLLLSRRGRKPRLRDEMAEAIGAPVLASVAARWPRDTAHAESLARLLEPDVMNSWSIRRALEDLGAFNPVRTEELCLSFVTLNDDHDAFAVGPQFALLLNSQGVPISIETSLTDDWVVELRALLTISQKRDHVTERVDKAFVVAPEAAAPAVRIALGAVDRRQPKFDHPANPTMTILALTPGSATVTELARVALAAIDGGQRIDAILVANAEPGDGTIGRLAQPMFGQRLPLPNRLTGMTEGTWR